MLHLHTHILMTVFIRFRSISTFLLISYLSLREPN